MHDFLFDENIFRLQFAPLILISKRQTQESKNLRHNLLESIEEM